MAGRPWRVLVGQEGGQEQQTCDASASLAARTSSLTLLPHAPTSCSHMFPPLVLTFCTPIDDQEETVDIEMADTDAEDAEELKNYLIKHGGCTTAISLLDRLHLLFIGCGHISRFRLCRPARIRLEVSRSFLVLAKLHMDPLLQ